MNKKPLVSVIMPVYNGSSFVSAAIESILKQDYPNFEFIIVDDASVDNSWNIISKYQKQYPKVIKAIRLKNRLNKGGDACANEAFKLTHGTYIARMDADDIAHPNRLTKQVEYMENNPDVLLLGSQARVINKTGDVIGDKTVPTNHKDIYENFFIFNPIIHPTIMLRKSLLPNKTLYKIKYSANNDLYTFFGLLQKAKFVNLNEALVDYRVHGDNDSLTKPKERFFNTLKIRIHALLHGYKPTWKGILITGLQTAVIACLPETMVVPVYMYIKGIAKLPKKLIQTSPIAWTRVRYYVGSLL